MTRLRSAVLALAVLAGCGCATIDRISGSGSMRIEVEVYKGPLAQDPWTQWGEIRGLVADAEAALRASAGHAFQVSRELKCRDWPAQALEDAAKAARKPAVLPPHPLTLKPPLPDPQKQACDSLFGLLNIVYRLQIVERLLDEADTKLQEPPLDIASNIDATRLAVRKALQEVSRVAIQMRASAFFLSVVQLSSPLDEREARTALTNVSVVLSELANQIVTRSDALLQQMVGPDRRELPLSLHVRNTNPTDFVNLYVWNRAAGAALAADILLRFPRAFTSEETADRVRGYERLFADYNWSNVNSVYASGQGDVAMAFIKDDIGNWNLKNFSNDPTELLKSYTEVAKATLATAVELAKTASGPGAATEGVATLTDLASRITVGRTSAAQPTVAGLDVGALHARAVREISGLKSVLDDRQARLNKEIQNHEGRIRELQTFQGTGEEPADEKKKREDALDAEKKKRDEKVAARDGLPGAMAKEAQVILERHRTVIELLQDGIATSSADGATSKSIPAAGGAPSAIRVPASGSQPPPAADLSRVRELAPPR